MTNAKRTTCASCGRSSLRFPLEVRLEVAATGRPVPAVTLCQDCYVRRERTGEWTYSTSEVYTVSAP